MVVRSPCPTLGLPRRLHPPLLLLLPAVQPRIIRPLSPGGAPGQPPGQRRAGMSDKMRSSRQASGGLADFHLHKKMFPRAAAGEVGGSCLPASGSARERESGERQPRFIAS